MPTSQAHCFLVKTGRLASQMITDEQAASSHVNPNLLLKTLVLQPLTHRPPPKMLLWASLSLLLSLPESPPFRLSTTRPGLTPVTSFDTSMVPFSLIRCNSSSKTSSSSWWMYLLRGGWGIRLCWETDGRQSQSPGHHGFCVMKWHYNPCLPRLAFSFPAV